MVRKTFEFGGIQDGREASKLIDCSYRQNNVLNLAEVLRKRYDMNFEVEELESQQNCKSYLLKSDKLRILISNNDREVREGRLTHSWDRGYMDERINYGVLTGYVEGDFGNGELKSIEDLIQEFAKQTRREFSVCSDEESAKIDTR